MVNYNLFSSRLTRGSIHLKQWALGSSPRDTKVRAIVLFVLLTFYPLKAQACTCTYDFMTMYKQADVSFAGKVTGVMESHPVQGLFQVVHPLKGVETETIRVKNDFECAENFEQNKAYLVFALRDESGNVNTNSCMLADISEDTLTRMGMKEFPDNETLIKFVVDNQ